MFVGVLAWALGRGRNDGSGNSVDEHVAYGVASRELSSTDCWTSLTCLCQLGICCV